MESLESRDLLAADLGFEKTGIPTPDPDAPQAIVGGNQSLRGEYDWIVSLQIPRFGHTCGGTLVSPTAVITAAHCVEGSSASQYELIIGREDLNRNDDGTEVGIEQIIVHPDYDSFSNGADIAILLLEEPVPNEPIDYLNQSNASLANAGVISTSLGWGATREGGSVVSFLREVDLPIVSNAVANAPAAYNGQITDDMLPAGQAAGGIDSCQGDSGGPLIVRDSSGNPQLAGVVSWGEGCARPNKYGLYARVTSFTDWIDEIVGFGPEGRVNFNQERYVAGNEIEIRVQDENVEGDSVDVMVTSDSGDQETLTLTETGTGRYVASIAVATSEIATDNGQLDVSGEELLTVTYLDVDNGEGVENEVSSTALIVVDDFGNEPSEAAPIALEASTVGEIDLNGDTDWFQFDVEAGTGYEFLVDLDGESLNDSELTIYGDGGEMVLGFNDNVEDELGSQIIYFPNEAETVFIEVGGFGANIGTYSLSVIETDEPSDDHPNIVGGSTVVEVGDRERGTIGNSDDADWFQFEAEAGVTYRLDVSLITLDDSQLRLVDSDGRTELAFNDDVELGFERRSEIYYRSDESETLFMEVTGWGTETGSYRVGVEALVDDHGNNAEGATEIGEVTATVTREFGELTPEDVDWFSVSVKANLYYEFRTLNTSGDTVLRVLDETGGEVLARNDDADFNNGDFLSTIVWQAPRDGDFHVEVSAYAGEFTYQLNARQIAPDPDDDYPNRAELAESIDVPERVTGSVDFQADVDWFQFDAIEGGEYTFRTTLRGLDDSVLQLFSEDGETLVAENDDVDYPVNRGSLIEWTAESTGTYYIVVSGFDGSMGTYRLRTDVEIDLVPGDVNLDRVLDSQDIDLLFTAINEGLDDTLFDVNDDDEIDQSDVDALLDMMNTIRGDANLDGIVDFSDFLAMSRGFGTDGGWSGGDFDGSGETDFQDFLELSRNFDQGPDADDRSAVNLLAVAFASWED